MNVESLAAVAQALEAAGVVYVVVGGVAVIAHGYVRTTTILDLVVALDESNCRRAMEALKHLGYAPRIPVEASDFADPERRQAWIRDKGMIVFQLVSDAHPRCPIDVFVSEPFDVAEEHRRAAHYEIEPGVSLPVVRFDTLLRMKRTAARPIDRDDVDKLVRLRKLLEER